MSSEQIDLVAIICPREGKVGRIEELVLNLGKSVEANEPDTLRYQIHREVNKKTGVEEVIILETYKNQAAQTTHFTSEGFKSLGETLTKEDLLGAPLQVKFVKQIGGFASRKSNL